jgi:O-acetyl-ADP-ribose deacetylase (regulator of RNase III)
MIEYVNGNFFDHDADIRINTVNCVGVMGAGVALQYKKKYPDMYKEYLSECQQEKVLIGKPHVWRENKMFEDKSITIINFPTKKHWKNPSEYSYVEEGLKWLQQFLSDKDSSTITLPALGCGHGGLDWSRVKPMIEYYLGDLKSKILVFEPYVSIQGDQEQLSEEYLKEIGITQILPHDSNFPNRLKGRSSASLFIKGDQSKLEKKILSIIVDSKPDVREREAVLRCIEVIPEGDFVFLLGFNSSFEIDIAKVLMKKHAKMIIILPIGIAQLKIRKDVQPFWNENNITLISLDPPKQTWKVNQSISALKFRIKMSDAILIANHELGSISKFENELSESRSTIFYINYWEDTKDFYQRLSARKIGRNRQTHSPNIAPIVDVLY